MSKSYGKRIKRYVDHPKGISKLSFLIHVLENSSEECEILGDYGSKYYKIRPTKYYGHETAAKNKFIRQKDYNAIVQYEIDEIILQENNKLSAEYEAQEKINHEIDENDLYEIDTMSLDEYKE